VQVNLNFLCKRATYSLSVTRDVRDYHVVNQRGLASACLTDDVHVPPTVLGFDAKAFFDVAETGDGEWGYVIVVLECVHAIQCIPAV